MQKRVLGFIFVLAVLLVGCGAAASAHGRHGHHPFAWHHRSVIHYRDLRTTTTKPTTTTQPTTTTFAPTTTSAKPATTSTTGAAGPWRLEFTENFDTDAAEGQFLNTYPDFTAYPYPWTDTSGFGTYQPDILSVSGGNLQIAIRTENGKHLVAAPEPKVNNGQTNQLYGRYEVRFKADQIAGYKTAWLLWPQSDQWNDGEIDFPEGSLNGHISAFNHHAGDPRSQEAFSTGATYADWHVATTEWSPGQVKFFLDGALVGRSTKSVMSKPAHVVLQTETALGQGEPVSDVAGTAYIDSFRAWAYNG